MELTASQLDTLRHMLGINTPRDRTPKPYRDYYCANPGDPELIALAELGAVTLYSDHGNYHWYRCTPAGRLAAMRSHRSIRLTKAKRVYVRFLEISDVYPDLTFREFITLPTFADTRSNA